MTEVFVYGTLTRPERVSRVLDSWAFGPDAVIDGLERVEGRYPTLIPGGSVAGRILETSEIGRLDTYEGVDRGLYVRVRIPWSNQPGAVLVYIGDPESLGADVEDAWPGDESFTDRVHAYLRSAEVSVRITDR